MNKSMRPNRCVGEQIYPLLEAVNYFFSPSEICKDQSPRRTVLHLHCARLTFTHSHSHRNSAGPDRKIPCIIATEVFSTGSSSSAGTHWYY